MRDSKRDIDVQNSLLDSVGEGEVGMIWENGIEPGLVIRFTYDNTRFIAILSNHPTFAFSH